MKHNFFWDSHNFDVFKIGLNQFLKFNGLLYHPYYDMKRGWENCAAINRGYTKFNEIVEMFNANFTDCF